MGDIVWSYDLKNLVILLSVSGLLCLIGLLGNAICIVVWTRPQMKSPSAVLMTALAVTDILVLTSNIGVFSWPVSRYYFDVPLVSRYRSTAEPFIIFWMYLILHQAETASTCLTLTITLERYYAVCYPFEYRSICSYRRSCKFAALVIIGSIMYNLIRFWEFEIQVTGQDADGNNLYRRKDTALLRNLLYVAFYHGWLNLFIRFLIPLAGIIWFNSAIYRELENAKKARETITTQQNSENRLTAMLLYVIGEFLVCVSLDVFFAITYAVEMPRYYLGFDVMVPAPAHIFARSFNSSVNFVTYMAFSNPFRKMFFKTFGCGQES